jgi:uridylate kinase
MKNVDKKIVISLGGSMVVPDQIDTSFLKEFILMINKFVSEGYTFCIIVGGGKTARNYQKALSELIGSDDSSLDWVGIYATRMNADLVRLAFGDSAHEKVVWHPFSFDDVSKPVLIGAGHEPGNSSDLGAVIATNDLGASKMINLSSIDYVYSEDPRENLSAKKFEDLSWGEYLSLIPNEWKPGMSTPFDPVASKRAKDSGIEVAVIDGNNLESVTNYIKGKDFKGTRIHD